MVAVSSEVKGNTLAKEAKMKVKEAVRQAAKGVKKTANGAAKSSTKTKAVAAAPKQQKDAADGKKPSASGSMPNHPAQYSAFFGPMFQAFREYYKSEKGIRSVGAETAEKFAKMHLKGAARELLVQFARGFMSVFVSNHIGLLMSPKHTGSVLCTKTTKTGKENVVRIPVRRSPTDQDVESILLSMLSVIQSQQLSDSLLTKMRVIRKQLEDRIQQLPVVAPAPEGVKRAPSRLTRAYRQSSFYAGTYKLVHRTRQFVNSAGLSRWMRESVVRIVSPILTILLRSILHRAGTFAIIDHGKQTVSARDTEAAIRMLNMFHYVNIGATNAADKYD